MTRIATLKPRVTTTFLGIRPGVQNRQSTRALNTGSTEWRRLRKLVLVRDLYQCQGWPAGHHAENCNGMALHVDHDDGDDANNSMGNLRSLSPQCHSRKTARQDGGFGNR